MDSFSYPTKNVPKISSRTLKIDSFYCDFEIFDKKKAD